MPLGLHIWRYAKDGQWRTWTVKTEEVARYRVVLGKCTLRAGKDGSTTKLGSFTKGDIVEVLRIATNKCSGRWHGLTVLQTLTPPTVLSGTMRAELIGHFEPCMTDIYLHIDAHMADYIRTHP